MARVIRDRPPIEDIKVYEASGLLIAAVGVVVASLPRLVTQWRTDRPAAYRTAAILLLFVAYMGLGGYLLLTTFPGFSARPIKLLGFAGTAIGWIVYGEQEFSGGGHRAGGVRGHKASGPGK